MVLAGVTALLYGLTRWEDRRIPRVAYRPRNVRLAPAGGAAGTGGDTALADTLGRLESGLRRGDERAVARLAAPDGVQVGRYTGLSLAAEATAGDPQGLLSDVRPRVLGWQQAGTAGLVVVLTDGWQRRPMMLEAGARLDATPLMAFWLEDTGGTWFWRALTPDTDGALTAQARQLVWQPVPAPQ